MPIQLSFVKFTKDSFIILEDKKADRFFIIHQGQVQISKEIQVVAEEQGDTLGPGDIFGVVSTMSGHNHIETAKALTDVTLIPIHRDQYDQLIQGFTPIAMKIILQFSQRVRHLDKALARLTLKSNAAEDESHFLDVADYYAKQGNPNAACYAYYLYIKRCPTSERAPYVKKQLHVLGPRTKSFKLEFKPEETIRSYVKDSMVFCEGEEGHELFIIQKGSVKIVKVVEKTEVLIAILKAGDIFGEMAILESKPRTASAVAFENCQLMAVNRKNFGQLIAAQPQLVTRLTTLLADRVWLIYKQLANTQISDPLGRMFDMLNIQLEKKRVDIDSLNPFIFDFGIMELINMVGLPANAGRMVTEKLLESRCIEMINEKICTTNVGEIARQSAYYHRIQHSGKFHKENASYLTLFS